MTALGLPGPDPEAAIPRERWGVGHFTGVGAFWRGQVVLPQAFRNMLPVLLTQTIVLFQDTSLVYELSIPDFLGAASKVAQRDGRLVEPQPNRVEGGLGHGALP